MADLFQGISLAGWLLILLGILLVLLPTLARHLPSVEELERISPLLIYVYKRGNFTFVTSPILILLSLASILWMLLRS